MDNEITFDGTFVNFAFSFDITWGTDFPYSGVFWTDTHNTDWSTIDVELRGLCRNASIQIHVGNTRALDKRNCDSHSEKCRKIIKTLLILFFGQGGFDIMRLFRYGM